MQRYLIMCVFLLVYFLLGLQTQQLEAINVSPFNPDFYKPYQWDWKTYTKDFDNVPRVSCPAKAHGKCICKSDLKRSMYFVNCRQKAIQLGGIGQLPANTTHCRANNIDTSILPNGTFDNATHLVYLDLSMNVLRIIENDAFAGLSNLVVLDLSRNMFLTLGEFLRPLLSLQVLNLFNSRYDGSATVKHIVNGISNLKLIERLKITCHYITKDDVLLLQNTSVTYVSITRVHGIEQAAFSDWKALNSLDLIPDDSLERFPSKCPIVASGTQSDTNDLQIFRNLSSLHVESLYIEGGLSGKVHFHNFEAPNLIALAIMNTEVRDFDFKSLNVPTLRWLDISSNRIRTLYMPKMQQLMYLNISHQTLKRCFPPYTILPDSLMSVDFSGTPRCSPLSICLFHIEFVNLRNTRLTKFFDDVNLSQAKEFFTRCINITGRKVAIKHLDLQDNDLQCVHPTIFTKYDWSALNILKLSNNRLGFDDSACVDTNTSHSMDFLRPLRNLTELYLDGNPIKYVLLPNTLLNQTKLQYLNLSVTTLTNLNCQNGPSNGFKLVGHFPTIRSNVSTLQQ